MNNRERDPSGIGGWLLVFLLSLGIATPLSGAARVYFVSVGLRLFPNGASRDSSLILSFESGIAVLHAIACWCVVWRLSCVRRWSSVLLARTALWVLPLIRVIAARSFSVIALGSAPSYLFRAAVSELIGPAVSATLWTAYLLRSRRVRATYPRPGALTPLADVFT